MYICPRCGYSTKKKTDMKRHIDRKNVCQCLNSSISIEECVKLFKNDNLIFKQKTKNKKKHKCKCGREFDRKIRLQTHEINCKNNDYINEIKLLEKKIELEKLQLLNKSTTTNTGINNSNINSHNNITNNITINAFKDMDYNLLKDEILLCLENQDPKLQVPAFEQIIDAVHFNKDNPSNHNIYKPNVRDDRILTFNGDDFVVDKMAIDVILKKLEEVIENSIDKENGKVYLKKLKNHLKLKQEDNDYHEATKDDIAVGLYNGRKTVISTHKNLK
jgi:hypothetical protein